jgi:hypothetical protein
MSLDRLPPLLRQRYPGLRQLQQASGSDFLGSVLVRVRNEAKELPRFVESLRRQSVFEKLELIVLDSESTDATLSAFASVNCSIYQIPKAEFSFGQTCNLLMALSTTEVNFFFSGHVCITSARALEVAAEDMLAGRTHAGFFRQIPNEVAGASVYDRVFLQVAFPARERGQWRKATRFSNAASVVSRSAWEKLWFPDVVFSEDALWATKLASNFGWSPKYYAEYTVEHSHNDAPGDVEKRVLLNAIARRAGWRHVLVSVAKFPLMVGLLARGGAPIGKATQYAVAHVSAYLRSATGRTQ